MGNFVWNGEEFLTAVERVYSERMGNAAELLADRMRANLATPGPPRSKPGESPHIDTDALHGSITTRGDGLVRQAGSPVDHAVYTELGTGRRAKDPTRTKRHGKPNQIGGMEPRPWALKSLLEAKEEIVQAVTESPAHV